tara:strand:- start:489 stop:821 length:333 start_codon:yes stop_codon:yes gene_type:complete
MDITLIAIILVVVLAIVFLLLFLFKNIKKQSFIADDGSVFKNQIDLDLYQSLYNKTKPLFSAESDNATSQELLGFENSFLSKLTSEGFKDLKSLVKYRSQFKLLSELINI